MQTNITRKLLVVGYVWPEPNSSAAGSNMLGLLRLFREYGWQVDYASPATRGEYLYDLDSEQITQHDIVLNCSSFDTFVTKLQPDAVIFDRYMMEEQFSWRVARACPDALRILNMEDMHSLRNARHEAVKKGLPVEDAELHTDLAKRELAAVFRSDLSLVISEVELELLTSKYQVPDDLLQYWPLVLEPRDQASMPSLPYEERNHFITIGNFRHEPNWDAVLWLKQEIWPLIRKSLPKAELHIYGAYPPPKATQLHNAKEGFLIKGWAEDSQEVMAKARVCLAPLRFGAGIKGKLIEAMLCKTPSVTTNIGAEGIQGISPLQPWPGAVTNTAYEFAQQAIDLYTDAEQWQKMQHAGEHILEHRFNAQERNAALIQTVDVRLENIHAHREKNFIGSMLLHHTMKSTQYMSQWIEAKNQLVDIPS
ncbi:MAG: glycosyltransferase [Akkermansiaceae bacterium]